MEPQNLPENVLFKICRYIDTNSKLNLMLASKFFYNFIAGNQDFCKFNNFYLLHVYKGLAALL